MKLREAWVTEIPFPGHGSIVLMKMRKGQADTEPAARRLIASLLASISLERLTCHIAIGGGEFEDDTPLFGTTPAVETGVRSVLIELPAYPWRAVQFD